MIKVQRHGNKIRVSNPVDGSEQVLRNVVFTEEGRAGLNPTLANSNAVLNQLVGANTGLTQLRTHTQPVLENQLHLFPVDKEFPQGFINRRLYSTSQMTQQDGVEARMIDGKPTYVVTELGTTAVDDIDMRMSNETLAQIDPKSILRARSGVAGVTILEYGSRIADVNPQPAKETVEGQQTLAGAGI